MSSLLVRCARAHDDRSVDDARFATVGKLFAFAQSFGADVQATVDYAAYVHAGIVAGFDGGKLFSEDVFRFASFTDASTVPDAGGDSQGHGTGHRQGTVARSRAGVLRLARDWLRRLDRARRCGRS